MSVTLNDDWVNRLVADADASSTVRSAAAHFHFASGLTAIMNKQWFKIDRETDLAERETGFIMALILAGGVDADMKYLVSAGYLAPDSNATFSDMKRIMNDAR